MRKVIPYLVLMRLDKPIGILLLLWPTYWALWLASRGWPNKTVLIAFTLGVIVMRSAGCVINDMADRQVDKEVNRTRNRPLARGLVGLKQAGVLLLILFIVALCIVSFLNLLCFYLAIGGALITLIYPFCKRFFQAPQLVLGLAFSWGIPMAFAAVLNHVPYLAFVLMAITFVWVVAYDTQYAMVDRDDDLNIGVKSTAILFGAYDKLIIFICQVAVQAAWLVLAWVLSLNSWFYFFWFLSSGVFVYQQKLTWHRERMSCFKAFLSNHWYGFFMFLGLVVGTNF